MSSQQMQQQPNSSLSVFVVFEFEISSSSFVSMDEVLFKGFGAIGATGTVGIFGVARGGGRTANGGEAAAVEALFISRLTRLS